MKETIVKCDVCLEKIPHEEAEYLLQNKKNYVQMDLCKRCYMQIIGSLRAVMEKNNPSKLMRMDESIRRL